MAEKQTTIYATRSSQDAQTLRGVLAKAGIPAVVAHDIDQQGSGEEQAASWPTQCRVVVDASHAERARQFALDFNREKNTSSSPAETEDADEQSTAMFDHWPRCPQCDTPRSTRCLVCGTAGTEFPPVDMGFIWIPGPDDEISGAPCHCGSGSCNAAAEGHRQDATYREHADESPPTMLICTTCDEPFVPEYPRICEWCGHQFQDGFEVELLAADSEQIGPRAMLAAAVLIIVAAAVVAYFAFVVRY